MAKIQTRRSRLPQLCIVAGGGTPELPRSCQWEGDLEPTVHPAGGRKIARSPCVGRERKALHPTLLRAPWRRGQLARQNVRQTCCPKVGHVG